MSKDVTYRRLIQAKEWRTLRNAYLSEHPMCEECLAQGRYVAANCVHHIVPVESAKDEQTARTLCYSVSNLRALCLEHHSEIHRAERSHSKEAHKARTQDALERWKANHPAPTADSLNSGGNFLNEGGSTPKSTCPSSC